MLNLVNTSLLFGGVVTCRCATCQSDRMAVRVRDSGVLHQFATVGWRIGRVTKILDP